MSSKINEKIQEELTEGLIIKNYKELCKLLDMKVKTGNSKIAQMNEIERYVKFKKEGYKFIVMEIYEIPLPSKDKRAVGGKSKYDKLMDHIIINLLIKNNGEIEESYTKLLNDYFDLFTKEYKKLRNVGYKRYSEINGMSKGLVMMYQQKMDNVVRGCLERTLARLKRNGIITYEQSTIIVDDNFKKTYANKKSLDRISKIEKKVYEEMSLEKKKDITPFMRNNNPAINAEFKSKVCNYMGIMRYWKVLNFALINNGTEEVGEDIDELVRRFVKSTVENTINTESVNELTGEKYKPYSAVKFKVDIDRLTRLLWNLPEGYMTDTERNVELVDLFDVRNENIPF